MQFATGDDVSFENRHPVEGENPMFYQRWSPRSFQQMDIPSDVLTAVFSAARWSPSCFNEQPWLFMTSSGADDFHLYLCLLNERNQRWAKKASLLGFVFAKKEFRQNGKSNRWASFDCGAAWMALTLQARMFGLYTHAMAGIRKDAVYRELNISEERYEVICGFALGVIDSHDKLDDDLKQIEKPSARYPLNEIWIKSVPS